MAELEGQQLGNYRLIRLLGQGGFADVYQGEHVHLNTQAAIKVLRTRVTAENAAQFSNEAKIIAHLDHPNIVRVLEFGIENGMPFLVMDYAINGTLRQRHPKGSQIPLALVLPYIQQAASALQYAHSQKIIHRDLKPENMLLGKRGEILLSDFGLALTTQSSRYDSTQDIVGTVAYMAPEQLQGKPGATSDQYALGIVAYEWLCGERPFHGSFMEIYSQHMTMPPPSLCAKLPDLPIDVEQAIFLTLAKNPAERFQSVQAFANALANASQAMDRLPGEATIRHAPSPTPAPPANQPAQLAIDSFSTKQMSDQSRTPMSSGTVTPPSGSFTNQPGMVTPLFQPFAQPQVQQPFTQPQVQQPFTQPQVQQPFTQPQAQQPFAQPQAQQPFAQPQAQQPFAQQQAQQPFAQPQAQQPFAQQQAQQPQAQPQAQQPFTQPQVQQLFAQPQAQQPFAQQQAQQPFAQPQAQQPFAQPQAQQPQAQPQVQQPFVQPFAQPQRAVSPLTSSPNHISESGNVGRIAAEAPRRPKGKKAKNGGKLVALIAAILLIVLFGVIAIPRVHLPSLGLGSQSTATSTTGTNTGVTPSTQVTQGVTPGTVATISASTVTPTVPTTSSVGLTATNVAFPLTISCVQCGYSDLAVVLTSITANAGDSTTLWTFTVTNNGASQCSSISFYNLSLEGPDGTQYRSSGQANDNWSLNAGTGTNVSPTLALIPRSGTIYTLNVELNGSCMSGSANTYQTENLQFTPNALTGDVPVTPNLVSPKSPTFPLNIACVRCGYSQLSLVLTNITVSASNSTTIWSFTIANNGPSACSGVEFYQFQLEDPSGTQYQSSGQVNDRWSLNAGSSAEESPTLSFKPQPNTVYTLNIELNSSCMSGSANTYQTENLQF